MKSNRNIIYFFRNLGKKHRLSLRDQHNESEIWYMYISPLKLIGVIIAILLIVFILILTAAAFTPILNFVPGYKGGEQQQALIQNILRIDSIERKLNEIEIYGNDVSTIMDGKTPFIRDVTKSGDTVNVSKPEAVEPNAADSILRSQMESGGIYGLNQARVRAGTSATGMITPVQGVVVSRFSPRDGRFGTGIATASDQQVLAVDEGSVTLSTWSPNDGYIIQIQHKDNTLSVYMHLSQAVINVGVRVKKGEVIGYTGEGISGETGKGTFEIEIWNNGLPADPENYIVF